METTVAMQRIFFQKKKSFLHPKQCDRFEKASYDATHRTICIGSQRIRRTCVKLLHYAGEMSEMLAHHLYIRLICPVNLSGKFDRKSQFERMNCERMSVLCGMKFMKNRSMLLASYNCEHIGKLNQIFRCYQQLSSFPLISSKRFKTRSKRKTN